MEADMLGDGDDAGHCSNGASGWNYRSASAQDRATFRQWIRGVIAFYVGILALCGAVAFVNYTDAGMTQLAGIFAEVTASPLGPDNSGSATARPPAKAKSGWW
jgi:hypothetical protein